MDASKYYKLEGAKLTRVNRTCPKCGPSFFLANHYDRWTCGKCNYTIFKRKGTAKVKAVRRTPRKRTKSK